MLKLVSFDCWSTLICFDKESLVKMRHIRAKNFQIILSQYGYKLDEKYIQSVIKDSGKSLTMPVQKQTKNLMWNKQ